MQGLLMVTIEDIDYNFDDGPSARQVNKQLNQNLFSPQFDAINS